MQDWLDRFMVGKKKYSASIVIPIIVAIVNTIFAGKPEAQTLIALVQEFAPTLVAFFGGLVYTIMEGLRDRERAKLQPTITTSPVAQPLSSPEASPFSSGQITTQPPTTVPTIATPAFNTVEFHQKVLAEMERRGMERTPYSEVLCAEYVGRETPANSLADVYAYWQYLLDLAKSALDYYENQRDERGCIRHTEQTFALRATYRTLIGMYNNALANAQAHSQWFSALHRDLRNLYQAISLFSY